MRNKQLQREVAERKKIEQQLRESEERFKVVLSASPLGIVAAHVDRDLKYIWIYNPHPDFNPEEVIGKRDDEISANEGTIQLCKLKRRVIESGVGEQETITFPVSNGPLTYKISVEPMYDDSGRIIGATSASVDITSLKHAEEERENVINELQKTLVEIKTLRGILPLCSFCKKIRDDKGYWEQVDVYISKYSEADISHSICPECMEKNYPEEYKDIYPDRNKD